MVTAFGISSRRSPRRFASRPAVNIYTPVMLPPGRLRLVTRPISTGSLPTENTIGIVGFARFASNAAVGVIATSMVT